MSFWSWRTRITNCAELCDSRAFRRKAKRFEAMQRENSVSSSHISPLQILTSLLDAAPISLAMFDRDMRYLAAARTWRQQFQLPAGFEGRCFYDLGTVSDHCKSLHRRALNGEKVPPFESDYLSPIGDRQWLEWKIDPWLTPQGDVGGIVITSTDLTAKREAEERRERALQLLQIAGDALGGIIYEYDLERDAVERLRGLRELVGYDEADVPNEASWWFNQIHPDDRQGLTEVYDSDDERVVNQYRVRHRDGSYRQVEDRAILFRDASGRASKIIGCTFDISERMAALQALQTERNQRIMAAELTGLGVWSWDLVRDEIVWDDQIFRIYGVEPTAGGKVSYDTWRDRILTEDLEESERVLHEAVLTGRQSKRIFRIKRLSDGEVRTIEALDSMVRDENGNPLVIIGSNLDNTDRLLAEESLKKLAGDLAESDQRKGEFIAMLSHELRNPLSPLKLGIQALPGLSDDPKGVLEMAQMLERQVDQMVRLIEDLLDTSRISRGTIELRREMVTLDSVLLLAIDSVRPMISAARHEFNVDLPHETITLHADPTRISQIIGNLLHNAVKFTPDGGRIELHAYPEDGKVRICVRDNGIGIAPSEQDRIFDLYSQVSTSITKQIGLGIGLTVVRNLVEMHGGSVEVRSEGAGFGTEFIVTLPTVSAAPATPRTYPLANTHEEPNKRRILVVDDNRDAAHMLCALLQMMGHDATPAYDGLEAVEHAEKLRPDTIILDIGLPKLDGYDACRHIRSQSWGKDISMVALTGWGQEEDRRKAEDAGFDGHVVKPADLATMTRVLNSLHR